MPYPRGATGTVRGLSPEVVEDLMTGVVAQLREEETKHDEGFTRGDLLEVFQERNNLTEERAEAMVFAFWRTVEPEPLGGGRFRLPDHAEELVKHRDWRLTSGRLKLSDVIGLYRLLSVQTVTLTAGLEELRRRTEDALKSLRILKEKRQHQVK